MRKGAVPPRLYCIPAAGAPIVPIGQALLFNSFPQRQHANVMAIFGMANMVGPVAGPLVAGTIAEAFGWRWGFWMLLPVTVVSLAGLWFVLPREELSIEKPVTRAVEFASTVSLDQQGSAVVRRAAARTLGEGRELVIRIIVE